MPIVSTRLGKGVVIWHPELVNLYGCQIGDNTKISTFVEIGEGVTVGKNCRIGAHTFIPPYVTIEDNCFIGPHVRFVNDRYPGSGNWVKEETVVEEGAIIGMGATVMCGVRIGRGAMVGAHSLVLKAVRPYMLVVGVPAREIKRHKEGYEDT